MSTSIQTIQNKYSSLNKSLVSYIVNKIFPIYNHRLIDRGHNLDHILPVIELSLEIGSYYKLDLNMCLTIAAYHDIGLSMGPREKHHINSALFLTKDKHLQRWFLPEQITIMSEAVRDHRASLSEPPRSIYGKVVADADKGYSDIKSDIARSYNYNKQLYPNISEDAVYNNVYNHLKEKFGEAGYAKRYLQYTIDLTNKNNLERIRILHNEKVFRAIYQETINEI